MGEPPASVAQLVERLASENERWRIEAELRLIGLGRAAVQALVAALSSPAVSVRVHAAHALGKLRAEEAVAPLVGLLPDRERHGAAAIAAERALVELGEVAVAGLIESLRGEVSPRAVRALGKIGAPSARDALERLVGDSDPAVRAQAAIALLSCGGDEGRVEPLLADPDKWVRYELAFALAERGSASGRAQLEEAAADPEEEGTHTAQQARRLLEDLE